MGNLVSRAKRQFIKVANRQGYVQRAVRYTTIDHEQFLEHAAADTGISEAVLSGVARAICHQLKQMLLNGHSVEFPGVGYFRFGINAKAVENAEDVSADLVKRRKILFVLNADMQERLRRVSVESFVVEEE
ncbi:MAG: hypothetical protein IJV06_02800 [Bacteroidaceae bacterium]|nr:hypothetical protein [Bacteroidaceae bacterium]